ncbi:MAG: phospholipase D family protein [Pseudomonadota bacterium]
MGLMLAALSGCTLPSLDDRPASEAFPPAQTRDTRLGEVIHPEVSRRPDRSGIATLEDPLDAFAARALLAQASDRSLDVQYYIWQDDMAGNLLLHTLYRAAQRGVRVRLLLDDNGIPGMDASLAALNRHPNVEVRLFNPFVVRRPKALGYLSDFTRLNRRMHNKSFTVDNQVTVIGGRNIADAYFGIGSGALFADLDVVAAGPIVERMSQDFDRYWTSDSAYPAERLLPSASDEDLAALGVRGAALARRDDAQRFIAAIETSRFLDELMAGELAFIWAPVEMVSDDPTKALGQQPDDGLLSRQLVKALGTPERSVTLVSPYFVPGEAGVALFRSLEASGVEVRILTNSLAANDVAVVHSGYAKYRKPLLRAGVALYEMRATAAPPHDETLPSPLSLVGSSASSLHAKTFAVDGETLFVGSFNFDPRSTRLNTELGFLIESPALAGALDERFDERVPQSAYEVVLTPQGELRWLETRGDRVVRHAQEPDTSVVKRSMVWLFSLLPLEPLL